MNFEKETLCYDELEININRLLQQCLKHMKLILLVGVIGAILLPSMKYVKDMSNYEILMQEVQKSEEIELSKEQLLDVEQYFLLTKEQKQLEQKKEKSPLYQFDYENVYRGELIYLMESADGTAGAIAEIVSNYFNNAQIEEDLKGTLSFMDADYVLETSDVTTVMIEDGKKAILTVVFWAKDEDSIKEYAKIVKQQIENKNELIKDGVKPYQMTYVYENMACVSEEWIYVEQKAYYTVRNQVDTDISNLKGRMTDVQKLYIANIENNDKGIDSEITVQEPEEPSFSLLYGMIGLILGIVGVAITIMVVALLDGKLQSEMELKKRLKLLHLGTLEIRKVEKYQKQVKEIAEKILFLQERNTFEEVTILTTLDDIADGVINNLEIELKERNLEYTVMFNILNGEHSFKKLQKNSAVVLLETIGKSKVKNIYQEASFCEAMELQVIGYIGVVE